MTVNNASERIRSAIFEVAIRAYEDAGVQGLCAEGRWEAAVSAMRSLDLASILESAGQLPHPDRNQSPTETLTEYVRAFETLDPQNFASYYNLPCIFITPAGAAAAKDAAEVQALAENLVTQARRYGFKRTEVVGPVDCQMLSGALAVLSGVFRRFDSTDRVILDLGFTYVMQRIDDRWKIVVVAAYTPREIVA